MLMQFRTCRHNMRIGLDAYAVSHMSSQHAHWLGCLCRFAHVVTTCALAWMLMQFRTCRHNMRIGLDAYAVSHMSSQHAHWLGCLCRFAHAITTCALAWMLMQVRTCHHNMRTGLDAYAVSHTEDVPSEPSIRHCCTQPSVTLFVSMPKQQLHCT
ncbi:hypothetical protein COO60DRAFT_419293 [Scenedesmus sp. NREL 46B-D3]|nr:hypothetical protein COO60DRAFT_419293 [Scenedesmus sp. NREL 46B-D3]